MSVTIDQIKKEKATLEAAVMAAVQSFETKTGVPVQAIRCDHSAPTTCSQCVASVTVSL